MSLLADRFVAHVGFLASPEGQAALDLERGGDADKAADEGEDENEDEGEDEEHTDEPLPDPMRIAGRLLLNVVRTGDTGLFDRLVAAGLYAVRTNTYPAVHFTRPDEIVVAAIESGSDAMVQHLYNQWREHCLEGNPFRTASGHCLCPWPGILDDWHYTNVVTAALDRGCLDTAVWIFMRACSDNPHTLSIARNGGCRKVMLAAARAGCVGIVARYLDEGFRPFPFEPRPLLGIRPENWAAFVAARNGHVEVVRLLLANGWETRPLLEGAQTGGHSEIVDLVEAQGK
ncbi:hypothetical protein HKX48_004424 [Thoreauomyces humboldtii]|nr:hypothetical protein HKX48_004424 [Thoreauomyces humboldtii]